MGDVEKLSKGYETRYGMSPITAALAAAVCETCQELCDNGDGIPMAITFAKEGHGLLHVPDGSSLEDKFMMARVMAALVGPDCVAQVGEVALATGEPGQSYEDVLGGCESVQDMPDHKDGVLCLMEEPGKCWYSFAEIIGEPGSRRVMMQWDFEDVKMGADARLGGCILPQNSNLNITGSPKGCDGALRVKVDREEAM